MQENNSVKKINGANFILVLSFLYFLGFLFWFYLKASHSIDTNANYYFGLFIGIFTIFGGLLSLSNSFSWGFLKSALGRFSLFFGIGLLCWGLGNVVFAYYNLFQNITLPYPSLADLSYIIAWPFWAMALINIAKASGAFFQLKNIKQWLIMALLFLLILVGSYLIFIVIGKQSQVYGETVLGTFFNLAYPLGDVVLLTTTLFILLFSRQYLGGIYRKPILIVLFGFMMNYLSDFSFSYTTLNDAFFVGNWVDLLFLTTMFVLASGANLIRRR